MASLTWRARFPTGGGFRAEPQIIDALKGAIKEVDKGADLTNREIALIHEYRTRLIADVVTGKLDVRAVAAGLPDMAGLERLDEVAEGEDLDEEAMDEADAEDVAA